MPDFPIDPRDLLNLPGIWDRIRPRNTPSIRDQVKCPPGQHRDLATGACVADPPPRLVEVPAPPGAPRPPTGRERPPHDESRGPLPLPPVQPPVTPAPPPVAPAPSPADVLPPRGPVFPRTTPRGVEPTIPAAAAAIPAAVLAVLYSFVFYPYFRSSPLERAQQRTGGPPRRGGRRTTTATPPAPRPYWDTTYRPGYRGLPAWVPRGVLIPVPGADPYGTPRTVPSRPGAVPRSQPTVRTVPSTRSAPAPVEARWTLGDPLPGPGYDPFTRAPAPAPAPRAAPRPAARPGSRPRVVFPLPFGVPGVGPGPFSPALTPQPRAPAPNSPPLPRQPTPRAPPRSTPRPVPAPPPQLTPFNPPVPTSQPQVKSAPTEANPCTAQREARRSRQKSCRSYTTKRIRVCADKKSSAAGRQRGPGGRFA